MMTFSGLWLSGEKKPEFPYDQKLISKKEFDSWPKEDQVCFVYNYQNQFFLAGWNDSTNAKRKARGRSRLKRLKEKLI